MIEFNKKYITEWKNNIIFAPNGFGKTTLSKKIKNEIEKENPNSCLLFTRRQMDNLMSFSRNTFYFGESAEYRNKNKLIENNFNDSTLLRDFIFENYKLKSAARLKEVSLFFSLHSLKNLNTVSLLQLNFDPTIIRAEYGISEAILLDGLLNLDIYTLLSDDVINAREPKVKKNKTYISQSLFEILQTLSDYATQNDLDHCPLCGRKFSNSEKLYNAISRKLKKYEILDENNPASFVDEFYNCIFSTLYSINNSNIRNIFVGIKNENVSFVEKIKVLVNYKQLCDNNNSIIERALRNLKVNNAEVGSQIDEYKKNIGKIELSDSKVSQRKRTLDFISEEFNKIASYSEATLKLNYDNMSISVEGQDIKKQNIGDILSESESKRLCLVVLRAKVKYGKYSSIILDDPIDSYDDYYVSIVCSYIGDLVKENKIKNGFYVFTNNNNALYKLSTNLKCKSIVMYEDPDDVFLTNNTKNNKYLSISVPYQDVDSINKSEIVLLYEYLACPKNGTHFDNELAFIAFLTTVRNIKSTILRKYSNFEIVFKSVLSKADFSNKCKEIIEHLYMHYEPGYSGRSSASAKMNEAFDLYNYLLPIRNPYVISSSTNSQSLVQQREVISKTPFNLHTGNKLIALIFKKIVFVSELKYEFESIVLEKLEYKYGFSKKDIESVANCNNGFMSKIRIARHIDNINGKRASDFLDDVTNIHKKHSNLVNEFDHALNLMYPPYLNTRIFDIKKYLIDIERIKSSY